MYSIKMSQYSPELYDRSSGNVKVGLDISKCATKASLRRATTSDISEPATKTYLVGLKTKVDDSDVDKLKTVSADLSELSNVMDKDILDKIVHDMLATKVNAIDTKILSTCGVLTKTQYNADKQGLEKKI